MDENYPKKKRAKITELNISYEDLEGELDLGDFKDLETLDCSYNNLTEITLSPSAKEKIKTIIFDNNYSLGKKEPSLDFFGQFNKLETLRITATSFFGSLESLKHLNN